MIEKSITFLIKYVKKSIEKLLNPIVQSDPPIIPVNSNSYKFTYD